MSQLSGNKLAPAEHLKLLLLFALLAAIYIIPATKGIPAGDGYGNYHGFWWFKKALLSLKNPFYSDYFYYPQGANLAFYGGASFASFLLTLPISLVAGIHPAIMSAHFLGYLLSGYFTFLLVFDLTGSRGGGLVSGLIFAFAPYHFVNVPIAMILSSMQWMPLFFFLLNRTLKQLDFRLAVAAGASLALVVLADQMQAIMVAVVMVFIVPFCFVNASKAEGKWSFALADDARKLMPMLIVIVVVALLFCSPYLYAFADFMLHDATTLKKGFFDHGGANELSSDLAAFFLPPTYNPLWGKLLAAYSPYSRNVVYLGIFPVIMAAVGVICCWRRGVVALIFLITLVAVVISLGPTLHVMGPFKWNNEVIKLPFIFTADWPVIGSIRTPYRFHPLVLLGTAILAGFAVAHFRERVANDASRRWGVGLVAVLIMLDYLPGKTEYPVAKTTPALYATIAADKEDYAVLELPLSRWDAFVRNGSASPATNLYFQTVHGKRIFSGHMSRAQISSLEFNDPVLELIKEITTFENYGILGSEKREANEAERHEVRRIASNMKPLWQAFAEKYKVHYVVVQSPLTYKGSISRLLVEELSGKTLIETADGIAYIKVK